MDPYNLNQKDNIAIRLGFPNPGLGHNEKHYSLNLNIANLLVKRPLSTYLFRIRGDSWSSEGVFDGDLAIVDRSITPKANSLIICWQDDFTIKRLLSNPNQQHQIWGVITAIVHHYV